MTIAGTVIILEASGNNELLLPLMLTFAAARYTGNAFNESFYDVQVSLMLSLMLRSKGLFLYTVGTSCVMWSGVLDSSGILFCHTLEYY